MILTPCKHKGCVKAPISKSHYHRLLIANFLAGEKTPEEFDFDSADIKATKRCLRALESGALGDRPLPVGESGSTLRFLQPVVAALGLKAEYKKEGRLASRPTIEYPTIAPGVFELEGNVSSQYVTGLLFALPLLKGNSEIRFKSPLESRGYVDMTLAVVRQAGIKVYESCDGTFMIDGNQKFHSVPACHPEGDWSGAAFWLAMNMLGSEVRVQGLNENSAQPDRAIVDLIGKKEIDVSGCPDIFPVLSVVAAAQPFDTLFTGTRRLKLKESDRTAAMADVLRRFGVETEVKENSFLVLSDKSVRVPRFHGGKFTSYADHRIAMSIAVGATIADGPVEIDNVECAAKSYPTFFEEYANTSCSN